MRYKPKNYTLKSATEQLYKELKEYISKNDTTYYRLLIKNGVEKTHMGHSLSHDVKNTGLSPEKLKVMYQYVDTQTLTDYIYTRLRFSESLREETEDGYTKLFTTWRYELEQRENPYDTLFTENFYQKEIKISDEYDKLSAPVISAYPDYNVHNSVSLIREIKHKYGLTNDQIAEYCGVSTTSVRTFLIGARKPASHTARCIIEKLTENVDDLANLQKKNEKLEEIPMSTSHPLSHLNKQELAHLLASFIILDKIKYKGQDLYKMPIQSLQSHLEGVYSKLQIVTALHSALGIEPYRDVVIYLNNTGLYN